VKIPEAKPKGKGFVNLVTEPLTTDRLAKIVEAKRREVEALRSRENALREEAETSEKQTRSLAAALRVSAEVRLLAEIKRRSPSAGWIREDADPLEVARGYEAGGAAALSVLTDREFFGGHLSWLLDIRAAVGIPLLRKDFIIDPAQVWQSRVAGADAILLIVRILDDHQLADLHTLGREMDLDVLVEIHEPRELERALAVGATLIGINNRDLSTFKTDLSLCVNLAPTIDPSITLVGESGISTAEDVRLLGEGGVDAILVGESLMRQPDIREAAAALVGLSRNPVIRQR
jgi:indole-3-glycerol phosphate synthase